MASSESKRSSHIFSSSRKISMVFSRSASQSVSPPPVLSLNILGSTSSTSISKRSVSPSLSSSDSSQSQSTTKQKQRQTVSPIVVSSIINSMYAHPIMDRPAQSTSRATQIQPLRRAPSEAVPSSPPPSPPVRMRLGGSRSVAIKIQKSSKSLGNPPSVRSQNTSFHSASDESSQSHTSTTDGQQSDGKSPSTRSSSDSGSVPAMRVVGRGGTGSRPRVIAAEQAEAVVLLPKEQPAAFRPMGRGGHGSRQKPLKVQSTPALLNLLNIRKSSKNDKGKAPDYSTPIHPIPPHVAYQITNGSTSTLSTLHFTGETGSPPPRFFPSGSSVMSSRSDEVGFSSPPHSATSSVFPSSPYITITDDESDIYLDESRCSTPDDHRARNRSKLSRTLGEIPTGTMYDTLTLDSSAKRDLPILLEEEGVNHKPTSKLTRRASLNLSMSSLSSMFVRPTPRSRLRDSNASHNSMSTLPSDDLHRLDFSDRFSTTWGEHDSLYQSESPGSPILFSPPSPVAVANTESSNAETESMASTPQLEADRSSPTSLIASTPDGYQYESPISSPALSPPLSRSQSFVYASRRRSAHLLSHSYSTSTSLSNITHDNVSLSSEAGVYVTAAGTLIARSNWLIPPEQDDEEATFAIKGSSPTKPQTWTGEWNTDMKDVIRVLRDLR